MYEKFTCFTSTPVQILTRQKALSEKRAKLRDAFDKLEERRQMSDSRHKLQEEDRCYLWIYTYIQVSLVYISRHNLQEDRCHLWIYTYIQVSLVTPHCIYIYVYTYIIERERDIHVI